MEVCFKEEANCYYSTLCITDQNAELNQLCMSSLKNKVFKFLGALRSRWGGVRGAFTMYGLTSFIIGSGIDNKVGPMC